MKATTTLMATLVALATATAAQDEKTEETRRYDVRALAAMLAHRTVRFPFTSPPNRPGGAGEATLRTVLATEDDVEPDYTSVRDFVDLGMAGATGPGEADLTLLDGRLHVAGPRAVQARVAALLEDLGRIAGQAVDVELALLPSEALAAVSSAVLDAATFERLRTIGKPLAIHRTRVRLGCETLIEAVARRAYPKDYDTEVAQESKAFDPLIDVALEGTRAAITVHALPGGAFHVTVRGQQTADDGPARVRTLLLPNPGALSLPRMHWASTSATARVPAGGALIVGNDLTPRGAWTIRVSSAGVIADAPPGSLRVVSLAGMNGPPARHRPPFVAGPLGSGASALGDHGDPREAPPRLVAHRLVEDVLALRPDGVAPPQARARVVDHWLLLEGNPGFVAQAAELATRTVEDAARGVSVEVRFGTIAAADLLVPAPEDMITWANVLPHRVVTAATSGDQVVLIAGQSHSYLKDYDIEIAHGASVEDPLVDVFFTGLAASCHAMRRSPERVDLDLEFEYQELLELTSTPAGSDQGQDLEMPRLAAVRGRVAMDVVLGSWQLVHTAPLEGTDRQFVMLVRAEGS